MHLNDTGASDGDAQHFGVIGGLLQENITPTGLYCIILWTRFPNKAADLKKFLSERLKKVPAPFVVLALDKMEFLENGTVGKISELVVAIKAIAESQPQLSALLNWEEKVLSAASATIYSILTMPPHPGATPEELARILARLAVEAVGLEHVEKNRFHAVNESLLPILADRIANITPGKTDVSIWKKAFATQNLAGSLSSGEAARLNTFMHIDVQGTFTPLSRGVVSNLPDTIKASKFKKIAWPVPLRLLSVICSTPPWQR